MAVDFSEGRKVLRAIVKVQDVVDTEGQELNDALERVAALSTIDEKWTEHLRELDTIKEGIGLRAFGQKDPLLEYKMEAFKIFEGMIGEVNHETASLVMKAGPLVGGQNQNRGQQAAPKRRLDPKRATASHNEGAGYGVKLGAAARAQETGADRDPTAKAQPIVNTERTGRNDPCPCGSGKKYKHCHGRS